MNDDSPRSTRPRSDGEAGRGLRIDGLAVGYGSGRTATTVLSGLVASARRHQLTVLLGPNGTGKSTLLRTLAGLQSPWRGGVSLDGQDLTRISGHDRARRIGVVLTDRLVPNLLTGAELVGFGRHPHTGFSGTLGEHDHRVVDWALAAVDATHLGARDMLAMSDGERQRVLTARALAQEPSVLLLDEPSAYLDAPSRVALTGLLRGLASERGLAVVVSTHDVELALRIADAVWLISPDGTLHTGPPEQLILDGLIGEVFDTDQLRFDHGSGTFVLRPATNGTSRVRSEHGPVLERALERAGWSRVAAGDADVEIRDTAEGYLAYADGEREHCADAAALADWARRLSASQPRPARADPADVHAALETSREFSGYFAVDVTDEPTGLPLTEFYNDTHATGRAVDGVARKLDVTESRVAASTLQLGIAARLWSVALGPMLAHGVLVDLERLRVHIDKDGTIASLILPEPGGWKASCDPDTATVDLLARGVVDGHLRALHDGLAATTRVAGGMLWGNAASALTGAATVAARNTGGDPWPLVHALFDTEALASAVTRTATGSKRRSCCLFYRTPAGGTCGDCPLTGSAITARKEKAFR